MLPNPQGRFQEALLVLVALPAPIGYDADVFF